MTKPQVPRTSPEPAHKVQAPTGSPVSSKAVSKPVSNAARQLASFEAAMKRFHARQFKEARELFLEASSGPERDVAQRSRVHMSMCDRRTHQAPVVNFATAEECYNYGVAMINARNLAEARAHLEKALQLAPGQDHIHYALALAQGLSGDFAAAHDNLRMAIELQPRNRMIARQDADFAPLAHQPAIHLLLFPEKKTW